MPPPSLWSHALLRSALAVVSLALVLGIRPAHAQDPRDDPLVTGDPAATAIVEHLQVLRPGAPIGVLDKGTVTHPISGATYTLLKVSVGDEGFVAAVNQATGALALDAGLPEREAAAVLAALPPAYHKMTQGMLHIVRQTEGGTLGSGSGLEVELETTLFSHSSTGLDAIEAALGGVPFERFDQLDPPIINPDNQGNVMTPPPPPEVFALDVRLPLGQILALGHGPDVIRIEPTNAPSTRLNLSVPRIGADTAQTRITSPGFAANIAIVDTGIDANHPTLPTVIAMQDFTNSGNTDDPVPSDPNQPGHGTHVAGIATSTDATFTGMAPFAGLINAKAIGGGPNVAVSLALIFSRGAGADVINGSYGAAPGCGLPGVCLLPGMCRAPAGSVGRGCLTNAQCGVGGSCVFTGSCTAPAANVGRACALNSQCDSAPGNGRCGPTPPTCTTSPACTLPGPNGAGRCVSAFRCLRPAASARNPCRVNQHCGVGGLCLANTRRECLTATDCHFPAGAANGTCWTLPSNGRGAGSLNVDHEVFTHNVSVAIAAEELSFHGRCVGGGRNGGACGFAVDCPGGGVCQAAASTPNDAFNVITVGASTLVGPPSQEAAFSQVGPTVDGRSKPDVMAPGANPAPSPGPGTGITSTHSNWERTAAAADDFGTATGTSMAAPHVAGLAGLLVDFGIDRGILTDTPYIKAAVLNTAVQLPNWSQTTIERDGGLTVTMQPLDTAQGTGEIQAQQAIDAYADDLRVWQQRVAGIETEDSDWYYLDVDGASNANPKTIVSTLVFERHVTSQHVIGAVATPPALTPTPPGPTPAPAAGPPALNDLDLRLYDPAGKHIFASISFRDNVEHIAERVTDDGRYCIEVDPFKIRTDKAELYAVAANSRLQFTGNVNPCLPDFGDAPDPGYPTLLASDGARHLDWTKEWLGTSREEIDGELQKGTLKQLDDGTLPVRSRVEPFPSVSGERDANDLRDQDVIPNLLTRIEDSGKRVGGLDGFDDGVRIKDGADFEPGKPATLAVTVQTTIDDTGGPKRGIGPGGRYDKSDPAKRLYLNAWADWNGNHSWADAGEQIIDGVAIDPETFGTNDRFTIGEKFEDKNRSGKWEPQEKHTEEFGATEKTFEFEVTPPANVTADAFYFRFRLDYGEDVGTPTGAAAFGEVEDHKFRCVFTDAGESEGDEARAGAAGGSDLVRVADRQLVVTPPDPLVFNDTDGNGFCECPPGKTVFRGTLRVTAANSLEFSGKTLFEAHRFEVDEGAMLVGEPETLRSLELRALQNGIVSAGTLDIAASDDIELVARKGSIDLGGAVRLAAADRIELFSRTGGVTLAPEEVDPNGPFTLLGAKRVEVTAKGSGGHVRLARARVGAKKIEIEARANSSRAGPSEIGVRDRSLLTTDRERTGLGRGSAGDVELAATGRIVVADDVELDSERKVRIGTRRRDSDLCLANRASLQARDHRGRLQTIDLGGVRGTVLDDGTTSFDGRLRGDVDGGTCAGVATPTAAPTPDVPPAPTATRTPDEPPVPTVGATPDEPPAPTAAPTATATPGPGCGAAEVPHVDGASLVIVPEERDRTLRVQFVLSSAGRDLGRVPYTGTFEPAPADGGLLVETPELERSWIFNPDSHRTLDVEVRAATDATPGTHELRGSFAFRPPCLPTGAPAIVLARTAIVAIEPAPGEGPLPSPTTPAPAPTATSAPEPPTGEPQAWRFYVRIARIGSSSSNVNVPKSGSDTPVPQVIRTDDVAAFELDRRVPGDDVAALGGDTLSRLIDAAEQHIRSHPDDYPGFASVTELKWAKRVDVPAQP